MDFEYKGYIIRPYKLMPSSYCVSTAGHGGKIPAVLDGLFTSVGIAKDIVDTYLAQREAKNGKAGSQSRD